MRNLLFIIIILFNISCLKNSSDNKTTGTIEKENIKLSDDELNDPRWIKVDNMDCYLFESNMHWTKEDLGIKASYSWEGDCFDGKVNGYGKALRYIDGELQSEYVGNYQYGIRKGKAKLTLSNGDTDEGDFFYNTHGNIKQTKANGETYEGTAKTGKYYTGKKLKVDGAIIYYVRGYKVSEEKYNIEINKKDDFVFPELGVLTKYYFDENWEITENIQDAKYYRLVNFEGKYFPKDGLVRDFFISGKIQNKFYVSYLNPFDDLIIYDGINKQYDEKGSLISEKVYKYGQLENLKILDNGTLEREDFYEFGKRIEHNNFNGNYKIIYNDSLTKLNKKEILYYYGDGSLYSKGIAMDTDGGTYSSGIREIFNKDGSSEQVYKVNFNELINSGRFSSDGLDLTLLKDNKVELMYTKKGDDDTHLANGISNPINLEGDYSIEFDVEKIEGVNNEIAFSLGYNWKSFDDFFSFSISGDGHYRMDRRIEGIDFKISGWKKTSYIKKYNSKNNLKLLKLGNKMIFSINGGMVKKIDAFDLSSNNVVFLAPDSKKLKINSIEVKKFIPKEQTEKIAPIKRDPDDKNIEWKGAGSGIIISNDGLIATNYHVIEDSKDIQVTFLIDNQIKSFKASIIKNDEINDLSIIKIEDPQFKKIKNIQYNFNTDISSVGQNVFTLGYPLTYILGEEIKFTDGRISSRTGFQGDVRFYQTTAPIQPGNSGGPLFDFKGNLIGINSAVIKKEIAENVSYSIKTIYLKNLIDVLPFPVNIPDDKSLARYSIEEQAKILSLYTVLVKVR
tara:strand:- start:33 stop:2399 length:2367 start_codon:yes stop_codon:yes gene_type:complete